MLGTTSAFDARISSNFSLGSSRHPRLPLPTTCTLVGKLELIANSLSQISDEIWSSEVVYKPKHTLLPQRPQNETYHLSLPPILQCLPADPEKAWTSTATR